MDRKQIREIAKEIAKLERKCQSDDPIKVQKAQSRLMEIFDQPEVFENIDRIDDMVQNFLENS